MTDKETDIVHPISVEGKSSRRETSTPLRDKFQHILTFRAMSGLQEKNNRDQSVAGDLKHDGLKTCTNYQYTQRIKNRIDEMI